MHSLLPLFCLSTQSYSLAALIATVTYFHGHIVLLLACTYAVNCKYGNSYIQCAWGPCNHHQGFSSLVLLIAIGLGIIDTPHAPVAVAILLPCVYILHMSLCNMAIIASSAIHWSCSRLEFSQIVLQYIDVSIYC